MRLRRIANLPELKFIEFCEKTYQSKKSTLDTIDGWFYEQGVCCVKKRRQFIMQFFQSVGRLEGDAIALKKKLDDFWTDIGLRFVLTL